VALKDTEIVSLNDEFPSVGGGTSLILTLIDPGRVTVCPGPICGTGVCGRIGVSIVSQVTS
jgi:hypothetical protein